MVKKRIEIIGNIASGRSTLAKVLSKSGINLISENFESHPFLNSFYDDPREFAFETEMCFLLQHYYDYKTNSVDGLNVCDYSIFLDDAFSRVTLLESEYTMFSSLKDYLIEKNGLPDLVLYTMCKPETSYKRIMERNRTMEKSIEFSYLELLDKTIREVSKKIDNLIIIDTDEISLIDESFHSEVIRKVENFLTD